MNKRELREVRGFAFVQERGRLSKVSIWRKHERVLGVPPLDFGVVPNSASDAVDDPISTRFEQADPIVRPLLVHVMRSSLVRDCRREDDDRT